MAYQQFSPPIPLHPWVKCSWRIERTFAEPVLTQEILPDSYLEVVFCLGDSYHLELADGVTVLAPPCYVLPLLAHPVHVRATAGATVHILAARCYPWAAAGLLGLSFANPRPLLTPLIGADWEDLTATLHAQVQAGHYAAAAAELFAFLAHRLPAPPHQPDVRELAHLRQRAAGASVGAGGSAARRHLERLCRRYAGTSPKQLLRLVRFEQVRDYLYAHPATSLAAVAYDFGFADQAHLTHEFRRFARLTPGQFAARCAAQQS